MRTSVQVLAVSVATVLGGWSCTGSGTEVPEGDETAQQGKVAEVGNSTDVSGGESVELKQGDVGTMNLSKEETMDLSEEEWRKRLTPEQYYVCREKGTERAFTGKYWDSKKAGTYTCVACGNELFSSETKFESGTGWPSYYAPIAEENVKVEEDRSMFMVRTEVLCGRCNSHLGHVFDDGPAPTNMRYCINSVALDLKEKEPAAKPGDG